MKSKVLEIPEAGIRITIEYPDSLDNQFTLPLFGRKMSLHDIEVEVCSKVLHNKSQFSLSTLCRLQHIKDARHVFCVVATSKYGYTVSAVAEYLRRSPDTVKHSIKCVRCANEKQDPSLWAAYKRYES